MGKLTEKINNLNPIFQNVLVGTVTGVVTGYVIKEVFQRTGGYNLIWVFMIFVGPLVGYLSGRERLRLEKMKMEKAILEGDIEKMQATYQHAMNKYRLLFDNISDAIYLTSEDGRFLIFNEATSLLSGYSREELKNKTVAQLQMDEEPLEDHRRAWLDNGICRYEERWKTKNGKTLYLDVNSKWIKLTKNQYILHVARDVLHSREASEEKRVSDLRLFQESKLSECSRAQQFLYRQIVSPISKTFGVFGELVKKYPSEEKKINEAVSDWDKVKKFIRVLVAKNARDLQPHESEWDVNDVIHQELHYLEMAAYDQNIMVTTRFASELPNIYASGRQFSIALGSLLLAVVNMLGKAQKKQMTVTTRLADDQILVEIQAPEHHAFEKHLSGVLDPSYAESSEAGADRGITVINKFLDSLNGKLEVVYPENQGILLKVKISASKNRIRIPENGKKPKGPKASAMS